MKKETFMAILEEDSMIFTEKELWEMIDEELAKDPSEMDTDLVDLFLLPSQRHFNFQHAARHFQMAPSVALTIISLVDYVAKNIKILTEGGM